MKNTNAYSLHRQLGMRLCAVVAAALLTTGCDEDGADVEDDLDGEVDDEDEGESLDEDERPASCDPTMHLFPVAAPHNIGYDNATCGTGTCEVSCPDVNANSDYHTGIDVFAHLGAPLVAVTDGTVIHAGEASSTSGLRVKFRDACGWDYYYGHMEWIDPAIVPGEPVQAGQVLGTMGNTGTSGVHLHFNVSQNGDYDDDINPFDLLVATSATACGG